MVKLDIQLLPWLRYNVKRSHMIIKRFSYYLKHALHELEITNICNLVACLIVYTSNFLSLFSLCQCGSYCTIWLLNNHSLLLSFFSAFFFFYKMKKKRQYKTASMSCMSCASIEIDCILYFIIQNRN
jgi:hypothetical protein